MSIFTIVIGCKVNCSDDRAVFFDNDQFVVLIGVYFFEGF